MSYNQKIGNIFQSRFFCRFLRLFTLISVNQFRITFIPPQPHPIIIAVCLMVLPISSLSHNDPYVHQHTQ